MKAGRPSKAVKNILELADVSDTPNKMARVNFNLEEDKYIAFKKYALDSRKTVTQLLTEMIDEKIVQR
jgi:hypothetical protein